MESPEKKIMDALKYGGSLNEKELSELVRLGTKLINGINTESKGQPKGASSSIIVPIWWKYGQPPIIDRLGFRAILDSDGVNKLVSVISKNADIANAIQLKITPGSVLGPDPHPWIVQGTLGAREL